MRVCAICSKKFEAKDPAVLYVTEYGSPRALCEECEVLLDKATNENDPVARKEAREALSVLAHTMKDRMAMDVLRDVLDGKTSAEESEQDILEEIAFKESLDEEEKEKKESPIWDYLTYGLLAVAAVGFLLWFIL